MTVDEINYIYKSCATCGFQYGLLLLTTYIVPIAEGGTDTYSNKLGLCPNCSRMFNKGQMLVDETGKISLNLRHVEEAKRHNLASVNHES